MTPATRFLSPHKLIFGGPQNIIVMAKKEISRVKCCGNCKSAQIPKRGGSIQTEFKCERDMNVWKRFDETCTDHEFFDVE